MEEGLPATAAGGWLLADPPGVLSPCLVKAGSAGRVTASCSHSLPCVGSVQPCATGAATEAASCRCCCRLVCSPVWAGAGSPPCLWCCNSTSMYAVTAPAALPRQRTAARCTLCCPLLQRSLPNLLAGEQTRRQAARSKTTRQAWRSRRHHVLRGSQTRHASPVCESVPHCSRTFCSLPCMFKKLLEQTLLEPSH